MVRDAERAGYFSNRDELTGQNRRFVDEIVKGVQADVVGLGQSIIRIDRGCTPTDQQTCPCVG